VENLFALSFMVKDGKCMIRQGAHGQLEVAAVPPSGDAAGSKPRTQFVISQSREDWELWKQYVRPQDCVMRHRGSKGCAATSVRGGSSAARRTAATAADNQEHRAAGNSTKRARR